MDLQFPSVRMLRHVVYESFWCLSYIQKAHSDYYYYKKYNTWSSDQRAHARLVGSDERYSVKASIWGKKFKTHPFLFLHLPPLLLPRYVEERGNHNISGWLGDDQV